MKAALLFSPHRIEINEVKAPQIGPNQVGIQPMRAGVCGSDVSLYCGHRAPASYPLLLGHELVGRVSSLGEGVTKFAIGQRVIVEPNYPCGTCLFCRSGRGNICPNKSSAGVNVPGCFAEAFVAPAEFVFAVPEEISDADAATIEPLAVSYHALRQSATKLGDTIAVLGCGATGLLMIQVAVAQGLRVIAHDKFADKLAMAKMFGAVVAPNGDVAAFWQSENVTTVFECAGVTSTAELALSAVPRGGQVILVGLANAPATFVPLRLVREGIHVSGSIIYDHPKDFADTMALIVRGVLHPAEIVSETLPLSDVSHALELASTGQVGKVHLLI